MRQFNHFFTQLKYLKFLLFSLKKLSTSLICFYLMDPNQNSFHMSPGLNLRSNNQQNFSNLSNPQNNPNMTNF